MIFVTDCQDGLDLEVVVVYSGIALFVHSTILRRGDLSVTTGNVKPLSMQLAAESSQ